MKEKIIYWLKNALLLNISIFLILAPFSKKGVKIRLLIALALWILITIAEFGSHFYKHLIAKTPVNKPLLFFWIALLLSTIFSIDPYYSHAVLLERYLGYILFFFLGSYLIKDNRRTLFLLGAILFSSMVMGIGGLWDHVHNPQIRLDSSFGYLISITHFLVIYTPLNCIVFLFIKNKFFKFSALFGLLFLFPSLIFTFSRGAWVSVLGSLLIVSFFKNRKIACCLLIVFILIGLFLPQYLQQRAITTVNPLAWGERLPLWKISLKIAADFPVFGAGLGMYEKILALYWKPSVLSPRLPHWDVHNNYLQVVSETGIIGLIAFIWIFISFFKHVFVTFKKMSEDQQVILMSLTGSVLASLIFAISASNITVGVQPVAMFWFLFGMASGLIGLREDKVNTV